MTRSALLLALCCLALPAHVEARPSPYRADTFAGDRYVSVAQVPSANDVARSTKRKHPMKHKRPRKRIPGSVAPLTLARGFQREVVAAVTQIVGGRPAGCPHRFCGCGASLHLFGRIIPRLNLAANWLSFPRTAAAPNMVAARRGHVFVLKRHIAGNVWLVFDANSGGHRTRIHPRSIAGYAIVNPHG